MDLCKENVYLKNCVKVFPEGGGFVNITDPEGGPTATGMILEGGTTEKKLPSTPVNRCCADSDDSRNSFCLAKLDGITETSAPVSTRKSSSVSVIIPFIMMNFDELAAERAFKAEQTFPSQPPNSLQALGQKPYILLLDVLVPNIADNSLQTGIAF